MLVPAPPKKILILYASQTGTAQIFAMQLADALDADCAPLSVFIDKMLKGDTWYILIVSTAGVGEPPDNGRAFFEALANNKSSDAPLSGVRYSVFALGNSQAHPHHSATLGSAPDPHPPQRRKRKMMIHLNPILVLSHPVRFRSSTPAKRARRSSLRCNSPTRSTRTTRPCRISSERSWSATTRGTFFLFRRPASANRPTMDAPFTRHLLPTTRKYLSGVRYSVFALGNSQAHPHHYGAFGQNLDALLQKSGATPVLPLVKGDDAQCLEDDFDRYQQRIVELVEQQSSASGDGDGEAMAATATMMDSESSSSSSLEDGTNKEETSDTAVTSPNIIPHPSTTTSHSPKLAMALPSGDTPPPAADLLLHSQFYAAGTARFPVTHNRVLRDDVASTTTATHALRELQLTIPANDDTDNSQYETGDHLLVYPRNSDILVEAYLEVIGDLPDPQAVIAGRVVDDMSSSKKRKRPYPYPVGLTVYETLRHCVDLQAPPSPAWARALTHNHKLDYKNEIDRPRRTVLELLR